MGLGQSIKVDLDKYLSGLAIFTDEASVQKLKQELKDYGIEGVTTIYTGLRSGDGEVVIPYDIKAGLGEGMKGVLRFNKGGAIYEGWKGTNKVADVSNSLTLYFVGGLFGNDEISEFATERDKVFIEAILSASGCWTGGACDVGFLKNTRVERDEKERLEAEAKTKAEAEKSAAEAKAEAERKVAVAKTEAERKAEEARKQETDRKMRMIQEMQTYSNLTGQLSKEIEDEESCLMSRFTDAMKAGLACMPLGGSTLEENYCIAKNKASMLGYIRLTLHQYNDNVCIKWEDKEYTAMQKHVTGNRADGTREVDWEPATRTRRECVAYAYNEDISAEALLRGAKSFCSSTCSVDGYYPVSQSYSTDKSDSSDGAFIRMFETD